MAEHSLITLSAARAWCDEHASLLVPFEDVVENIDGIVVPIAEAQYVSLAAALEDACPTNPRRAFIILSEMIVVHENDSKLWNNTPEPRDQLGTVRTPAVACRLLLEFNPDAARRFAKLSLALERFNARTLRLDLMEVLNRPRDPPVDSVTIQLRAPLPFPMEEREYAPDTDLLNMAEDFGGSAQVTWAIEDILHAAIVGGTVDAFREQNAMRRDEPLAGRSTEAHRRVYAVLKAFFIARTRKQRQEAMGPLKRFIEWTERLPESQEQEQHPMADE